MHPTTLKYDAISESYSTVVAVFQVILNECGDDDVTDDGSDNEYEESCD